MSRMSVANHPTSRRKKQSTVARLSNRKQAVAAGENEIKESQPKTSGEGILLTNSVMKIPRDSENDIAQSMGDAPLCQKTNEVVKFNGNATYTDECSSSSSDDDIEISTTKIIQRQESEIFSTDMPIKGIYNQQANSLKEKCGPNTKSMANFVLPTDCQKETRKLGRKSLSSPSLIKTSADQKKSGGNSLVEDDEGSSDVDSSRGSASPSEENDHKKRDTEVFDAVESKNLPNLNEVIQPKIPHLERAANPILGRFTQSVDGSLNKGSSDCASPRSFNSDSGSSHYSLPSNYSSNNSNLSIQQARERSYLVGSSHVCSLLGSEELTKYLPSRKLTILVATWNMHEEKSVPDTLDDLLLPTSIEHIPDVYAIGTQETLPATRRLWDVKMQETIGPSHILLSSANNGTLHLSLFVRRDLSWFCSAPEFDIVVTRAVSNFKTKGAVAMCFTIFGTSLLFLNSHLTAGEEKNSERVNDYLKIVDQVRLPKSSMVTPGRKYQPTTQKDVTPTFDYTFWFGDLNFRLGKKRMLIEPEIHALLNHKQPDYDRILSVDQLRQLLSNDLAFKGFSEGHIQFPPSYKYDLFTDDFDTSKKGRVPSYTDRVLYRCRTKNSISCLHYDSVRSMRHSDHRPVYGVFELNVRPGRDAHVNLSAGHFCRDIYLEALSIRAMKKQSSASSSTRPRTSRSSN